MIWNDAKIIEWGRAGGITPFNENNVNPASIDLSWSGRSRVAVAGGLFVDDEQNFSYHEPRWSEMFETSVLNLNPGEFYLLDTLEYVDMLPDAVGKLFLKSSAGRLGIEHLHAGYVDPSFSGTLTLEIEVRVPWPVVIERGQRIVQLTMEQMIARPIVSYKEKGRYNGQRKPTASKGLPK